MLSIVVPVYNGEKYLAEFIDILLSQTCQDFEVIFIDDGSTDNSAALINASLSKGNFSFFFQKNKGAGAARNSGLSRCKGDYVWFADCDDRFSVYFVERMYGVAKSSNSEVVVCLSDNFVHSTGNYEINDYSVRKDLLPNDYQKGFSPHSVQRDFFHLFVWWPWDKIFNLNFIKKYNIQFDELRSTNDLFFVCLACLLSTRITIIEEVLAHHRINNPCSVSNNRNRSALNALIALEHLFSELKTQKLLADRKVDFYNYLVGFLSWHFLTLNSVNSLRLYSKAVSFVKKEFPEVAPNSMEIYYDQNKELANLLMKLNLKNFFLWRVRNC
ncbi:glycosyltransferase family 2 protein [Turicimonas muris]|uniref:glycosyltransferase family 2 protein n=1 Tax=Turicimonas muris TaxID=1796652 RepID=UPI0032B1F463